MFMLSTITIGLWILPAIMGTIFFVGLLDEAFAVFLMFAVVVIGCVFAAGYLSHEVFGWSVGQFSTPHTHSGYCQGCSPHVRLVAPRN